MHSNFTDSDSDIAINIDAYTGLGIWMSGCLAGSGCCTSPSVSCTASLRFCPSSADERDCAGRVLVCRSAVSSKFVGGVSACMDSKDGITCDEEV